MFRHTDFQRTEASYKAFVEGLFGDESYINITINSPPKPDMLLMVRGYSVESSSLDNFRLIAAI